VGSEAGSGGQRMLMRVDIRADIAGKRKSTFLKKQMVSAQTQSTFRWNFFQEV
jgi:hypothetical protein